MSNQQLFSIFNLDQIDFKKIGKGVKDLIKRVQSNNNVYAYLSQSERALNSIKTSALMVQYILENAEKKHLLTREAIHDVHLGSLFNFTLDDYVDVELSPDNTNPDELKAYFNEMISLCRDSKPATHDDPHINYIKYVTDRLRTHSGWKFYGEDYLNYLETLLDGMHFEFSMSTNEVTSEFEEYFVSASQTVGLSFFLSKILIVLGDESLKDKMNIVDMSFEIVSNVVRMSNDLRTYEKEWVEGKESSFDLIAKKFKIKFDPDKTGKTNKLNQEDIIRIMMGILKGELLDLKDVVGFIKSDTGIIEDACIRSSVGLMQLYFKGDFHTMETD